MKAAILLPSEIDIGVIHRARRLAKILLDCRPLGPGIEQIAIGLPAMEETRWRMLERTLKSGIDNVVVRHVAWEWVPSDNAARMFTDAPIDLVLSRIDRVRVPRDWGWNFADCSLWFSLCEPGLGPIVPLRPTAHYVADLAMRVVPDDYASGIGDPYWSLQTDAFLTWRRFGVVIASDPDTVEDVISYAGVRRANVMTVANLLDARESDIAPTTVPRDPLGLLWHAEPRASFDLANALEGLRIYLAEGGALKPTIITSDPDALLDRDQLALKRLPARLWAMLSEIAVESRDRMPVLDRTMARSGVLWSSIIAGGEGEAIFTARRHDLHFIGLDYPLQRRIVEDKHFPAELYKIDDPAAIAEALHRTEERARVGPATFPKETENDEAAKLQFGFVVDRLCEQQRD